MAKRDVAVYWHEACLGHDTGSGHFEAGPSMLLDRPEPHPEGVDRIINTRSVLARGPLAKRVAFKSGRLADSEELGWFHTSSHIRRLAELEQLDAVTHLEGPTWASRGTWEAVRAAAGTAIAASDAVMRGEETLAYALVRPPGHHAAPDRTDGGCFANNAALAALAARRAGAERVAIVDWDAHHGNGTQTGFYERSDVFTVSIHMDHGSWDIDQHPESGRPDEAGEGQGLGFNLNVPLPYGSGDRDYGRVFDRLVLPALERFQPDLIVGAAGQDAGQVDPNGRQCLTLAGFTAIGRQIGAAADLVCDGRLVLTQEGGYARTHTGFAVMATLAGVLDAPIQVDDPYSYLPEQPLGTDAAIEKARAALVSTRRGPLASVAGKSSCG